MKGICRPSASPDAQKKQQLISTVDSRVHCFRHHGRTLREGGGYELATGNGDVSCNRNIDHIFRFTWCHKNPAAGLDAFEATTVWNCVSVGKQTELVPNLL